MSDNSPHSGMSPEDSLDRLLTEAGCVDVNSVRIATAKADWLRITSRRRRVRFAITTSLCAVACLAVVSLFSLRQDSGRRNREEIASAAGGQPSQEYRGPHDLDERRSASDSSQSSDSFETYETVVLAIADRRLEQGRHQNRVATLEACLNAMEEAFRRQGPKAVDTSAIAQPLLASRAYESILLGSPILFDADLLRRRAATALLSEIASDRSLPFLAAMVTTADCPQYVLSAVTRVAPADTLARLVLAAPSEHQYKLSVGLLQKDDAGLRAYVRLVQASSGSAAILSAANELAPRQTAQLLELLQAPRVADRLTAAIVLGSIKNSRVTEALAARVLSDESRFEALVALAASQDPAANRFLAAAQQDVALSATVRSARNRAREFGS